MNLTNHPRLGGGVYDFEVLRRLATMGVEVDVPHLMPGELDPPEGWTVLPIPLNRLYGLGALMSNTAFGLGSFRRARKRKPDLLRIAYPYLSGPALCTLSRLIGVKTVAVFHHLEEEESLPEARVHRWVARASEGIHTGSHFGARQLAERYRVPLSRIEVIPYGVDERFTPDADEAQALRKEMGIGESPLILSVGSLIDRKNLLFLVEVFEEVWHREKNARWMICGGRRPGDDYGTRLEARIAASPAAEAIRLLGQVSESQKLRLYRAADVLVHPAKVEGFGFAPAEAMACETAVMVSNAGSLPELVRDGETGFVEEPGATVGFAEKLLRLVQDSALARSLGIAARKEILARFTWDRTAKRTLEYYERLCGIAAAGQVS